MIEINKTLVTAIATVGIFIISLIQMCHAMPGPEISVEPSYLKVSPKEEFTVNIIIDPKGTEISGVQYNLYFDNRLLNATSLAQGTFFSGFTTMSFGEGIDNTLGRIDYGEAIWPIGDEGVTDPGTLTAITFKAMEEPGTSNLNLSNVILSDVLGVEIPGVLINNGTCEIEETAEQTPTPTPTPTQTSTSTSGGGNDGSDEGASVTPTATSAPTPSPTPTQTSGPTPTRTTTINHVLSPSTPLSPTTTTSPTPTASMPLPPSEENNRLQGFEAAFAVLGLLATSYFILKRGGENK